MTRAIPIVLVALTLSLLAGCDLLPSDDARPARIPPPRHGDVPDSVHALYHEDAVRLALRHLHRAASPDTAEVELPEPLVTSFHNALLHVYLAEDLPVHDTLAAIHTLPRPETHSLVVVVDSNAAWVQAWREGERLTGQPDVDSLLLRYDLDLDSYHSWPWDHAAVLHVSIPLNVAALAPHFEPIPGVVYAEPNGRAGDGNDIRAEAGDAFWRLHYSIGWGDCPAGCISRRTWTVTVHEDGRVSYEGASGTPLPSSARMNNVGAGELPPKHRERN